MCLREALPFNGLAKEPLQLPWRKNGPQEKTLTCVVGGASADAEALVGLGNSGLGP